MPQATPIDFWFSIGSLYTYLSRDADRPHRGNVRRHVPLAAVLGARHHDRDGQPSGVEARRSSPTCGATWSGAPHDYLCDFPHAAALPAQEVRSRQPDRAGRRRPRAGAPDYARATYARWFGLGEEAGSEPNVSQEPASEIGQDPARVLALAQSDETGRAYDAATAEARASAFSARRPSSPAARFSGATTGLRTRCAGTEHGHAVLRR